MNEPTQASLDNRAALELIPAIARDDEGPVFSEPWEAEVFAMAVLLHEQGAFTWSEWAAQLHESIELARQQGDPDLGDTYYSHWLHALEQLVVTRNIGSTQQLELLYSQWDSAARTTPHGLPIELK